MDLENGRSENQIQIAAVYFAMVGLHTFIRASLYVFESILTLNGSLQTATVHQISSAEPVFKSHADPSLQKPLEDIMKKLAKTIEDFGRQFYYFLLVVWSSYILR